MNQPLSLSDDQLDALFARARAARPDTVRAEYGFETRLMARLRAGRAAESTWGALSWRMLPYFAAVVIILAFWHGRAVTEARETQQIDYLANAETFDSTDNQN